MRSSESTLATEEPVPQIKTKQNKNKIRKDRRKVRRKAGHHATQGWAGTQLSLEEYPPFYKLEHCPHTQEVYPPT